MKIILSNCIRETVGYSSQNSLWLYRLFVNLANRNESMCVMLHCRGINLNGPDRFRTEANDPDEQTCYFNKLFNNFSE